jgi:hypothetical protein
MTSIFRPLYCLNKDRDNKVFRDTMIIFIKTLLITTLLIADFLINDFTYNNR